MQTKQLSFLQSVILGEEKLCALQWVGLGIAVGGVVLTQLNLGSKSLFSSKTCESEGR